MYVFLHRSPPLRLGQEPLKRNVSILCFAQFASIVGWSAQATVRLRQRGVFNINSWILQNKQNQLDITQYIGGWYKDSNGFIAVTEKARPTSKP